MELVGCLQPRPHPTQLPSLKELLLHQWYPSPDTPLMPYQLAALPRSLHSLELHSLTLHPASLTHLTGLTQLYLCDMFFLDASPSGTEHPPLLLPMSLLELRVEFVTYNPTQMAGTNYLPLLHNATRLTALKLSIWLQHTPQLSVALAPLTRLAVLWLKTEEVNSSNESFQPLSDAQAAELGAVLSRLPLRELRLSTGGWWHESHQAWHEVLLQHCGAHVREVLSN